MDKADSAQQLLDYALDVGEGLLVRGAEVGRVEDAITRILRSQGAERVDVFTIISGIIVTCHFPDRVLTQSRRVLERGYDMTALTALNSLSREICAGELSGGEVRARLAAISAGPRYSGGAVVLFYAMTSFGLSLFFGGSLLDAALSGAIGMVIRLLLVLLKRLHAPQAVVTLLCAMAGGLLAHGLVAAGVPGSAAHISIGDIMLLVPGGSMMSAVRDMFTGDTISGLLRLSEALLLSLALALGFALPSLL